MTVETVPMSTGTVLLGLVLRKSFRVETQNAFVKHIYVTAKTIVGTEAMKTNPNAKQKLRLVLAVSSDAKVVNALHMKECVINRLIATTVVMNRLIVMSMSARSLRSISANTSVSIL